MRTDKQKKYWIDVLSALKFNIKAEKYWISIFGLMVFLLFRPVNAQEYIQEVIGKVVDKASQQPLEGASVIVTSTSPPLVALTNSQGYFRIKGVPVGKVSIAVRYVGYSPVQLNEVMINSGKALQLHIEMEEEITTYEEVVVTAQKPKARPTNEMATASARSFTVEETERYAGSRGDVARMASNFAGVYFANDQRNDIIIRGNSPSGLLWRLDDIEIPNPNHFAENGTTGGPVSMLNNNLLRNSDFYTGAFPAEFGNALSGVFDLKMRNGNSNKHEFTFQSGFNGFEIGAEGPIKRDQQSTYMAYYRYSVLDIMDKLGFSFGTSGVPRYQDFTCKINLPLKKGVLSFYTLAGKSSIAMLSSKLKPDDMYLSEGMDLYNRSAMAVSGISYTVFVNPKTYLKIMGWGLYQSGGSDGDTLDANNANPFRFFEHNIDEYRISTSAVAGTKYNARFNTRAGIQADLMGYALNSKVYSYDSLKLIPFLDQSKKLGKGPVLLKSYYEVNYKFSEKWELKPGIHAMYFTLNQSFSLEPRIGFSFFYASDRTLHFAYGLHSRTLPLAAYYWGKFYPHVGYKETNTELNFIRAHHWVIGHDWNFSSNLRLKTEAYYQYLFDIPVSGNERNAYSLLNTGAFWGVDYRDSLVNSGKGYNYGIEFTLERFLQNNFYYLFTLSLFESKYCGSDGILRNTAFNGNYVFNTLAGYTFPISTRLTLGTDIKISTAGGKRYTPIDLEASTKKRETVYIESETFAHQYAPFFKADFKIFVRLNKPRSTQEWQIYIENITNHRNILNEYYNPQKNKITTTYQLGFFPMVLWRLTF